MLQISFHYSTEKCRDHQGQNHNKSVLLHYKRNNFAYVELSKGEDSTNIPVLNEYHVQSLGFLFYLVTELQKLN